MSQGMTGRNLYLQFAGVNIAGVGLERYRNFNPQLQVDLVDDSAGTQLSKTYIDALADGTSSLTLIYRGSVDASVLAVLKERQYGTLLWGPEGTATGKPKGGVMAYVQSRNQPVPYNELATLEVTFQHSGTLHFDPATSTW